MTGGRVLVIEDEQDIGFGIRVVLERSGLTVTRAGDGAEGLRAFHSAQPDLVILDVGLPGMDGWTVLERIRDLSDVPILMLTARGQEADKVRGLNAGADDYLLKPFGNAELAARARALLRRHRTAGTGPAGEGGRSRRPEIFDDGVVHVNFASHEVRVTGAPVALTPIEYRLLAALVRHRGQVLSPEKLLELAWHDPFGIGPERVKYSVLRLRRKLGSSAGADSRIEAVRGFGYRYRAAERRHAANR
ncbi:MAG TPA: response regulator transcription factor [Trebonia sp.]|nr:response regulator transcription factor [Trebonia sp.]